MNPPVQVTAEGKPVRSPEQTLRRLFLTLFLRGRSARGLQKSGVPHSVGRKLAFTLLFYGLFGLLACLLIRQPVFALSLYLHAMGLVFLGMFVAASAGEVLFNQQEGDILLHRPVAPRALLWAKIAVLVQVALWVAGAFNLAGLVVGIYAPGGSWQYPLVHAFSTALEALFCIGLVVLLYQLCLRWFGKEKLDGIMTTAQVLLTMIMVVGGQLIPQLIPRYGGLTQLTAQSWWLVLLPPAWFAGLDDALAGQSHASSWWLAGVGLTITALLLWLAFGKLANNYLAGLQAMNEAVPARPGAQARHGWLARLITLPPLCWWLHDSVSRAGFLLTVAYLFRDRDTKLRLYPGLAPVMIMPLIMLFKFQGMHGPAAAGNFSVAFSGAYLGMFPLLALSILQYSQHWQAADLFRSAPLAGPGALQHGTRRAVLFVLMLPTLLGLMLVIWFFGLARGSSLWMLLPGLLLVPVYALLPALGARGILLSQPTESAKSAGRGLRMFGAMLVAMVLAGLATWAWSQGWFGPFLLVETVVVGALYFLLRTSIDAARWPKTE